MILRFAYASQDRCKAQRCSACTWPSGWVARARPLGRTTARTGALICSRRPGHEAEAAHDPSLFQRNARMRCPPRLRVSGRLAHGGLQRGGPSTTSPSGIQGPVTSEHGAATALQSRRVDGQARCRPVSIAYGIGRGGACWPTCAIDLWGSTSDKRERQGRAGGANARFVRPKQAYFPSEIM